MNILKNIYKFNLDKNNETVWSVFSDENNGKFINGQYGNHDHVEINYLHHKIIFDRYTHYQVVGNKSFDTLFTRVRLEFKIQDEFRFKLTKQGFINTIDKLFGAQDIQVGDVVFDKKFMIKGNNEYKIQTIFSNKVLQKLLLQQDDIQLQILDKEGVFSEQIKEGNAMLYYISEKVVKEKEQLNSLLKIYQILIDQLTKTNSIKPITAKC